MNKDNSKERSFGERVNTWVQTAGIVMAACWGIYTFYITQYKAPKSAPINITLNLQLRKIGVGGPKNDLVAVEMKVSATNPSSRQIQLLPDAWIASAESVVPIADIGTNFDDAIIARLKTDDLSGLQRHGNTESISVIAVGHMFSDSTLKPSETITGTRIIYLPKDQYSELDVNLVMPSGENTDGVQLEWTYDKNNNSLIPNIYHLDKNGVRTTPYEKDKNGNFTLDVQREFKRREFSMSSSHLAISLWQ